MTSTTDSANWRTENSRTLLPSYLLEQKLQISPRVAHEKQPCGESIFILSARLAASPFVCSKGGKQSDGMFHLDVALQSFRGGYKSHSVWFLSGENHLSWNGRESVLTLSNTVAACRLWASGCFQRKGGCCSSDVTVALHTFGYWRQQGHRICLPHAAWRYPLQKEIVYFFFPR